MTRSNTRSYWMTNEEWYTIVDGEFELTSMAPPEARRSFAEWKKPRKMTFRRFLRELRARFFCVLTFM